MDIISTFVIDLVARWGEKGVYLGMVIYLAIYVRSLVADNRFHYEGVIVRYEKLLEETTRVLTALSEKIDNDDQRDSKP
jgi:hypothetical protein